MLQNQGRISHSTPRNERARILLIDSNPQLRRDVTQFLADHYVIDAMDDIPTPLSLARERFPDLVLVDAMILWVDGFDLLDEFRRKAVPIILYSSSGDEESCLEGMEAGANDYLITPFSKRQLLTRVRAQLRA